MPERPDNQNRTDEQREQNAVATAGSLSLAPMGIAIGFALGVSVGLLLDNFLIGVAIGLSLGAALSGIMIATSSGRGDQSGPEPPD
jgi:uncharacterized membrane protein